MRLYHYYILGVAAILLASSTLAVAEPPESYDAINAWISDLQDDDAPAAAAEPSLADEDPGIADQSFQLESSYEASYGSPWLTCEPVTPARRLAARFGWWGLANQGAPYGVGEWMGLDESSPFWDVEGLHSDGYKTIDFFATGPENQSTLAGLYFYNPWVSADVDYRRFLHRLGHNPIGGPADANGFPPLGGFYNPPLPEPDPGYPMWGEDLNVNEDYAIRVQQFRAHVKGDMTENVSWRLNFWGMKKEGLRQTNSAAHCFDASSVDPLHPSNDPSYPNDTCHVVSQGQRIDWLTMEVEPVITARFGWLTLEYSRTMQSFQQSDDIVTYGTTRTNYGFGNTNTIAYAFVPDNNTAIDRLKVLAELGPKTDLYVLGHVGNTHNKFRDTDRKFYGVDARLTNRSIDGLLLTAYGKSFTQNNSPDDTALDTRYPGQANLWYEPVAPIYADPPMIPVDRQYSTLGFRSRWRPFYDQCGTISRLAVVGGYEYRQIERDHVTYHLESDNIWTQPTSKFNEFHIGLQQDWSNEFSSYVRYRMIDVQGPLYGVTQRNQYDIDTALNSNQPSHEDRVEIGGNWNPSDDFMLTGSFWIQNRYSTAPYVYFDEDNYPIVISSWYAPDDRWSFTGGYATFSNWIRQDITLGNVTSPEPFTSPWDYAGRADVYNLGAAFAYSQNVTLTSGVEYVRSRNVITEPASSPEALAAGAPFSDLGNYFGVRTNTWRYMFGTDLRLTQNLNGYFRYNYYDWEDQQTGWNSGTTHMFLAGVSGVY